MKKTVTVVFTSYEPGEIKIGGTSEHGTALIRFSMNVGERSVPDLTASVKLPVGEQHGSSPMEIGMPSGYKGPFDYAAFQKCAEKYVRRQLGGSGDERAQFSFAKGVGVKITGGTFRDRQSCSFQVEDSGAGW